MGALGAFILHSKTGDLFLLKTCVDNHLNSGSVLSSLK